MVMQRLHELDLAGYVLEKEKGAWEHLVIRMEHEAADNGRKTFTGWSDPRTTEGDLLFPRRFTKAWLEAEKVALGPSQSVGQLQQRPSNAAGNRFKREWWRFYTPMGGPAGSRPLGCSDLPSVALPQKFDRIIGSWDLTFKGKDDSDYVAGVIVACVGANRYIREAYCEQIGFLGSLAAIKKQSDQWSPWQILIEDKANGPAVIESLAANVPRLLAVEPRGGKESRAAAIEPIIAAGNVYLPEGAEWVGAFIEQFAAFPKGKNDDMVDAVSQALTHLEENSDVRRARALLGIT
jgi:predicted phage terminase large subunit-like protein